MLTGPALGNAIRQALTKKGVTQKALAEHFGVKPPSVHGWLSTGAIAKDKLELLWSYFSDVAGPKPSAARLLTWKHSREAQRLRSKPQRQICLGVRKPLQAVEHRADRMMYGGVFLGIRNR